METKMILNIIIDNYSHSIEVKKGN